MRVCSVVFDPPVEGRLTCDRPVYAYGLCEAHAWRKRKFGSPGTTPIATQLRGRSDAERFAHYRDTSPGQGPNGDCYGWTGSTDEFGYAILTTQGGNIRGHQFAWRAARGPVPDGMLIRHACDNPPCTREDHLVLGTQQDNVNDAVERGRVQHGSSHYLARLTDSDVREIKRRLLAGETQKSLALEFGVAKQTMNALATGRTWKHIRVDK